MLHFSGVKWRAVIPIFLIVTMAVGDFSPPIIGATINPAIISKAWAPASTMRLSRG